MAIEGFAAAIFWTFRGDKVLGRLFWKIGSEAA